VEFAQTQHQTLRRRRNPTTNLQRALAPSVTQRNPTALSARDYHVLKPGRPLHPARQGLCLEPVFVRRPGKDRYLGAGSPRPGQPRPCLSHEVTSGSVSQQRMGKPAQQSAIRDFPNSMRICKRTYPGERILLLFDENLEDALLNPNLQRPTRAAPRAVLKAQLYSQMLLSQALQPRSPSDAALGGVRRGVPPLSFHPRVTHRHRHLPTGRPPGDVILPDFTQGAERTARRSLHCAGRRRTPCREISRWHPLPEHRGAGARSGRCARSRRMPASRALAFAAVRQSQPARLSGPTTDSPHLNSSSSLIFSYSSFFTSCLSQQCCDECRSAHRPPQIQPHISSKYVFLCE